MMTMASSVCVAMVTGTSCAFMGWFMDHVHLMNVEGYVKRPITANAYAMKMMT